MKQGDGEENMLTHTCYLASAKGYRQGSKNKSIYACLKMNGAFKR